MDLTPMEAARIAQGVGDLAHAARSFCKKGLVAEYLGDLARVFPQIRERITEAAADLAESLRRVTAELKEQREDRRAALALTNRLLDLVERERERGESLATLTNENASLHGVIREVKRDLKDLKAQHTRKLSDYAEKYHAAMAGKLKKARRKK